MATTARRAALLLLLLLPLSLLLPIALARSAQRSDVVIRGATRL
jgi:hypothetical protein